MQKGEASGQARDLLLDVVNGSGDVCIAIRRASRAVTHLYELVLSPSGLKATQFVILQAIAEAGEMTQAQLAEQYGISPETLSRRLATLRRAGLVEAGRPSRLGGGRSYRLTAAGRKKLEVALPYWRRAQERLRSAISVPVWENALVAADQIVIAARHAEHARTVNRNPAAEPLARRQPGPPGLSYNPT